MSLALTQFYADYAPRVCDRLRAEPHASYRATFDPVLVKTIDLYPALSILDRELTTARQITNAVLNVLVPKASGKRHSLPVLRWALDRYLTDSHNGGQILAEDFYKIGDDITYFERLKKSPAFTGNPDLLAYKSLAALQAALAPHAAKRAHKAEADNNRRMLPEVKNKIMSETTVLYAGPEGRVVVPHTPDSSVYWGQATKWCLSGEEARKHFQSYNRKSPVVMLLPRGGDKTALVGRTLYNSADVSLRAWPDAAKTLWDKALAARTPKTAAWLAGNWSPELKEQPQARDPAANLPPRLRARFDQFKAEREAEVLNPHAYEAEFADKAFVLAVLELDGMYLQHVAPELKKDRDVVLKAVQENGLALMHVQHDPVITGDGEIVLTAVTQNGTALIWAAEKWQADRHIALTALRMRAKVWKNIAVRLSYKKDFVQEALAVNGQVLWELSLDERENHEYARIAVKSDGMVLDAVRGRSFYDFEILLAATQNNPWAFNETRAWNKGFTQTDALVAANPMVGLIMPDLMRPVPAIMYPWRSDRYFRDSLEKLCEQGRADDARPYLRFNPALWGNPDMLFAPAPDVLPVLEAIADPRRAPNRHPVGVLRRQ